MKNEDVIHTGCTIRSHSNIRCLFLGHWWQKRLTENNTVICKNCCKKADPEDLQEKDHEKIARHFFTFLLVVMVTFVTASCILA